MLALGAAGPASPAAATLRAAALHCPLLYRPDSAVGRLPARLAGMAGCGATCTSRSEVIAGGVSGPARQLPPSQLRQHHQQQHLNSNSSSPPAQLHLSSSTSAAC